MPKQHQTTRPRAKDEPSQLATLIMEKMQLTEDSPLRHFVRHRYWRIFDQSMNRTDFYSRAFTALTVLIIVGGVGSSVLASTSWAHADLAIGILGISVAAAAAVNRLWRPGLRAALGHRTANALRREGWRFVCQQGTYERCDSPTDTFFAEVERINTSFEAVDEQDLDGKHED